ncbi:transposase [Staphylococcus pseudintermedius]|uniref:transposase n=1 Tax=Staphylococcus pseudintermedius TaxID=283734 RepID=UPI001C1FF9BB|nr:transposase [Staphylococcus pseudintermedius]
MIPLIRYKSDVELTFGNLKVNLGFQRLSVRNQSKVEWELGTALMAVNIRKLVKISANFRSLIKIKAVKF